MAKNYFTFVKICLTLSSSASESRVFYGNQKKFLGTNGQVVQHIFHPWEVCIHLRPHHKCIKHLMSNRPPPHA